MKVHFMKSLPKTLAKTNPKCDLDLNTWCKVKTFSSVLFTFLLNPPKKKKLKIKLTVEGGGRGVQVGEHMYSHG